MLWGKKALRISAALGVAFAAAHTAERLKAPAVEQSLLVSAAELVKEERATKPSAQTAVPKSASLSSPVGNGIGDLVGITSVAATNPAQGADRCRPVLDLAALSGAMIHLSLSAPCNRGERIVVRHSGLSFAARTQPDGQATVVLPALKTDAMVAVYLQDAQLVLGKVTVPDAATYSRYAIMWELPADLELRVTDGDKVLVGSTIASLGADEQRVIALGTPTVPSPVLARVYSVPGPDLGQADITGELRITPASCGRTLRVDTVTSISGKATSAERVIAVPLCGAAGDILVLKNLAPAMKIAAPK
jgi:hypothetical protein